MGRCDDQKFLSPVTADNIVAPKGVLNFAGNGAQNHVARVVAKFIINMLEMINISHNQAKSCIVFAGHGEFGIQGLFHITAVVQAGQRVVDCLFAQIFLQVLVNQSRGNVFYQSHKAEAVFLLHVALQV